MDIITNQQEFFYRRKQQLEEVPFYNTEKNYQTVERALKILEIIRKFSDEENTITQRKIMDEMKKNGKVILLTATPDTILDRVKDDDSRPLLHGKKNTKDIGELMEVRRPKYEAAADIVVNTDGRPVHEIAEEIVYQLTHFGQKEA